MNDNSAGFIIHPGRGDQSDRKEVVTDGIIPEKGAVERPPSLSADVDGEQATGSQDPGVTVIQAHSVFTPPGVTVIQTPQ